MSQPIHHSQKIIEIKPNGNHVFGYYLLITYELKMVLMGFGKECKIIAPKELKKEIMEDLELQLNSYKE